jgi:hypothetical protein
MQAGDLVMLKYVEQRYGWDTRAERVVKVEQGDLGVFMETVQLNGAEFDLVLTGGKIVRCTSGIWSFVNEAG